MLAILPAAAASLLTGPAIPAIRPVAARRAAVFRMAEDANVAAVDTDSPAAVELPFRSSYISDHTPDDASITCWMDPDCDDDHTWICQERYDLYVDVPDRSTCAEDSY